MRVRRANVNDVPAILALERQSAMAAHWSRAQYTSLFAESISNPVQHSAWVVAAGEDSGGILAFLIARKIDAEWELENIVVSESVHRQGLGKLLLQELFQQARAEHGTAIFLEVRHSNQPARGLYLSAGFRETGKRKDYYASPCEDAVLYRLDL